MSHRFLSVRSWAVIVAALSFVAGFIILLHQVVVWGRIDVDQMLHHEFFAFVAMSFTLGFALCVYAFKVSLPKRLR